MNPTAQFTAARIADVIGKPARVIRRALASVPADGECVVRGNLTATWKVASLLPTLEKELDAARQRRGFATIAALFDDAQPWQPEVVWRDVCNEQQTEALKLQRALLPILERHRSPILDNGELV